MPQQPLGVQDSRYDNGTHSSTGHEAERGVTAKAVEQSTGKMGVTRSAEQTPWNPTRARRAAEMSDDELRTLTGLSDREEAERAYVERRLDPNRPRKPRRGIVL